MTIVSALNPNSPLGTRRYSLKSVQGSTEHCKTIDRLSSATVLKYMQDNAGVGDSVEKIYISLHRRDNQHQPYREVDNAEIRNYNRRKC